MSTEPLTDFRVALSGTLQSLPQGNPASLVGSDSTVSPVSQLPQTIAAFVGVELIPVGDGSDITAIVQSAMAAGRSVELGVGEFVIGDLTVSNLRIVGRGTSTIINRSASATRIFTNVTSYLELTDLVLDGGDVGGESLGFSDSRLLRATTPANTLITTRVTFRNSKWHGLFQQDGYHISVDDIVQDIGAVGFRHIRPVTVQTDRVRTLRCGQAGLYASGNTSGFNASDPATWQRAKVGRVVHTNPDVDTVTNTIFGGTGQSGNGIHGYLLDDFAVINPRVRTTEHSSVRAAWCDRFALVGGSLSDAGDTCVFTEFNSRYARIADVDVNPLGLKRNGTLTVSGVSGSVTFTSTDAAFVSGDVGKCIYVNGGWATITAVSGDGLTATATVDTYATLGSIDQSLCGDWFVGQPIVDMGSTTARDRRVKVGVIFTNTVSEAGRMASVMGVTGRSHIGVGMEGYGQVSGCAIDVDTVGATLVGVVGTAGVSASGNIFNDPKATPTMLAGISFGNQGNVPTDQSAALGTNIILGAIRSYAGSLNKSVLDGSGNVLDFPSFYKGMTTGDDGLYGWRDQESAAAHGHAVATSGPAQADILVGRIPYSATNDVVTGDSISMRMLHVEIFGGRRDTVSGANDRAITSYMIGLRGAKVITHERRHGSTRDQTLKVYDTGTDYAVIIETANQFSNLSIRARYVGGWMSRTSSLRPDYRSHVLVQTKRVSVTGWTDDTANWTVRTSFTTDADGNFGNDQATFANSHLILGAQHIWPDTTGKIRIKTGKGSTDTDGGYVPIVVSAPASSSASGIAGQVAYDTGYFYVCTATDTWRRTVISSW